MKFNELPEVIQRHYNPKDVIRTSCRETDKAGTVFTVSLKSYNDTWKFTKNNHRFGSWTKERKSVTRRI